MNALNCRDHGIVESVAIVFLCRGFGPDSAVEERQARGTPREINLYVLRLRQCLERGQQYERVTVSP